MAYKEKFGLAYAAFIPITAEPDNAHPTYGSTVTDLGEAVKANFTPTSSSGTLEGDNRVVRRDYDLDGGTLQMETLLNDLQVRSVLYGGTYTAAGTGSTATPATLETKITDAPVPGGVGYVQTLQTAAGIVYRATVYYKAVPKPTADNAETKKQGSRNYVNNLVDFDLLPDASGAVQAQADCATMEAAKKWIRVTKWGLAS